MYIVQANAPAMLSHGQSRIIGPYGNIIFEAGIFRDEIITATLDMSRSTGQTARASLRNGALREGWEMGIRKVIVRD